MAQNNVLLIDAQAPCISISVTTTPSTSVPLPSKGQTVRLFNEGTAIVYVSIGNGAQTATVPGATAAVTCTPVAVGDEVFRIPDDKVYQISAITATGTATLRVQVTEGT
jgi:hypothetical protein